ncbi:hypothetical protein TWF281_001721 [Arthrobotrys megalospora]
MSARQRHSRITTSDGWTTISNSNSRKSKNQNGKKNKNNKKDGGKDGVVSNEEHAKGAISALLAHKSDLNFFGGDNGKKVKGGKIDEEELVKIRMRLEKQIAGFEASECCEKLKEMVRREFGVIPVKQDGDGGSTDDDEKRSGVKNVLILALGSLSETFKTAPGYQLAAILSIINVLKESNSTSKKPASPEGPEKEEDPEQKEQKEGSERKGGSEQKEGPEKEEGPGKEENPGKEEGPEKETVPEKETGPEKEMNLKKEEDESLNIISYDPVYTPIDIHLLSTHNVNTIPAAQIPTDSTDQHKRDKSWYENAVVYMPHASVWLNHKYFMFKPKVWIGNAFEVYEDAVTEGGEVDDMLKEAEKVRREEGYVKLEWPEEGWGGGAIFNNLVVYVRKGEGTGK